MYICEVNYILTFKSRSFGGSGCVKFSHNNCAAEAHNNCEGFTTQPGHPE